MHCIKSTIFEVFLVCIFTLLWLNMKIYFVNFLLYYFDIFIFICGWHDLCNFLFFSYCFKILQILILFTFLSKISSSLLTLIELKRPLNLKKRKTLWPFFMDEVQLSQGYRATTWRQFTLDSLFLPYYSSSFHQKLRAFN